MNIAKLIIKVIYILKSRFFHVERFIVLTYTPDIHCKETISCNDCEKNCVTITYRILTKTYRWEVATAQGVKAQLHNGGRVK